MPLKTMREPSAGVPGFLDLAFKDIERPAHAARLDLVDDELADRFPNGVLHLADAHSARLLGEAARHHQVGVEMRLGASAPSICCLVALRLDQRRQRARDLNVHRGPRP